MKRFTFFLLILLSFNALAQEDQKLQNGKWAYYGEEFYSALSSKKIERGLLYKIFNSNHISTKGQFDKVVPNCNTSNCYKHVSVGYDRARKIMFGELDTLKDTKGTYVLDVYCGKKFYFDDLDDVSDMHTQVNIEHTWPQSRFNSTFPKDMQKSDMHHLYLTDSYANNVRGNSPFGFIEKANDRTGGDECRYSRYGFTGKAEVYTPPAAHRGNVARALFYFSMHYNLPIEKSEETVLRKWHKEDPVDANEVRRHSLIAKHQKVRNPFVDHPELVDAITDF